MGRRPVIARCSCPGCDNDAAEYVRLSTATDHWIAAMCKQHAEQERAQAADMRGKGDGRGGYFEGRR